MRQRGARDLQLGLDVADRDFTLLADEKEEDLQARGVRERLERFHVAVARLEPDQRDGFHTSKPMEISKQCQAVTGRPFTAGRSPARSAGRSHTNATVPASSASVTW